MITKIISITNKQMTGVAITKTAKTMSMLLAMRVIMRMVMVITIILIIMTLVMCEWQ